MCSNIARKVYCEFSLNGEVNEIYAASLFYIDNFKFKRNKLDNADELVNKCKIIGYNYS